MRHVYSFQGSKVHLKMDERLARAYNRAVNAWFRAQEDFEKKHGRKITSEEIMQGKLLISATQDEYVAWNAVHRHMNKLFAAGLEMEEADFPDDYLIQID